MNDEQLETFIKANEKSTAEAIERTVNGKIRVIGEKLDNHIVASREHWQKSTKFMEELQPVREGLSTLQVLNKFFKWIGLPSIAVIVYWVLSKL